MKDSVIIVSGGMDSITLLHEKAEEIALAVTFDYGSNHNKREAECAARHCQQLGIEHIIIPLAFIGQYFKSSLLEGADAVPEGHYEAENMKSTVVPFRNGIMLSVACGLAESRKLSKVLIANHGGDHAIYPDCRAGFVHSMSEAMRHGTYIGVQIDAPYTGIRKSDIARIGKANIRKRPWLLTEVTRLLDYRVIAHILREPTHRTSATSINLHIDTVTSGEFQEFLDRPRCFFEQNTNTPFFFHSRL